jgi:hypothetical protein
MKKLEKKEDGFTTIDFDCDAKTLKLLNSVAKLARVTLDQVVGVILATYVVNEPGFKASFKKPTAKDTIVPKSKKKKEDGGFVPPEILGLDKEKKKKK